MNAVAPRPNPETVEALLDTTWRIASAETGRTEALDRNAATVASFSSVLATLTATLGVRFVEALPRAWTLALFLVGLSAFLASAGFALAALFPREYLTLGAAYLERFSTWAELREPAEEVRGTTMRTLVRAVARERRANDLKARAIRRSFASLVVGLTLIGVEAATLAVEEVL